MVGTLDDYSDSLKVDSLVESMADCSAGSLAASMVVTMADC